MAESADFISPAEEARALELLKAYVGRDYEAYWPLLEHMVAEYDCITMMHALLSLVSGVFDFITEGGAVNPADFTEQFITTAEVMVQRHIDNEEVPGWLEQ